MEGDIQDYAKGNIETKAGGTIQTEAFSHRLESRTGDFEIEANDDVLLNGERVRLNSPRTPAENKALNLKRMKLKFKDVVKQSLSYLKESES